MAITITTATVLEADAAWRMLCQAETLPATGVRFHAPGDDRGVLLRRDDYGRLLLERQG